ncbi:hypothetical protein ACFWDZ_25860 [Micromonospora aurantiaca]|uniref:Chromosome segregation ATPase n=1 Tax=Micromonospora aurantiaca (nom. illeg.) TaxID=47850 RepID=A0A6N3K989_9ACTN|nr:hypothetical protein [Micromonospora aurantiaca]AXH93553.1 hypothetical protein DVH21_28535 [Micromonospora aurantiaca]
MYELNRVRLFGVGPRGARYSDVTLDLSDVGAIIPGQQASLFSAPVRRPSPYSLLLLENGGGKSVLLKLLFSVVLPGKRNAVGGSAAVMDKFVVGDDAAHVVLEWMNVRTGDRVITGKTLQRRRTAAAGERLAEHWWSLRPHAGVEIDRLPFTSDGRRLRLEGFREALQEIDHAAPVTQLTWVGQEVGEWARHLRETGIEPDLFGIQRRMNADEGDAANAFKFASSKEFVEWLLKVVLDPEDAVSVAENFDSYARTVGDRQAMLLERDLADGAVSALRPVATAYERHRAARAAQDAAVSDGRALLQGVRARVAAETAATQQLREAAEVAAELAATREAERERARDVVNEIRRQTIKLELDDARHEQQQATVHRDTAAADLRGLALADLLERHGAAENQAMQLAVQIIEAEASALPALQARNEAAGALLSKLQAEAEAARAERDSKNAAETAYTDRGRQLDEERTESLLSAEKLRGEHATIRTTVAEASVQVDAAVTDGLLTAGQDVAQAAAEAAAAAATAARQVEAGQRELKDATVAVRDTAQTARDAHRALTAARSHRDEADGALRAVLDRAEALTADELVRAALATEHVDVDMLDGSFDTLTGQLHTDETALDERLSTLRTAQRDDQRLLDALGDGGLLPPRAEVEASLDALHAAGIGAHAGWRYLAENVAADERDQVIATHPQLADGVIVVGPGALPAARDALTAARLRPAAAVAVGTGARMLDIHAGGDRPRDTLPDAGQFVIEPNPALFDPETAERRRLQLRDAMAARGAEIGTVAATLTHLRELLAELASWRRTCPAGHLAALRDALAAGEEALAEASEAEADARAAAETAEAARDRIDAELGGRRTADRAAAERAATLKRLAAAVEATAVQRRRLPELDEAIKAAERGAQDLTAQRDRALQQANEAARDAEAAAARAARHQEAMRDVVTSTGKLPDGVPSDSVTVLRAAYQAAAHAYAAVEVGHDLRAVADTAEAEAARLRADVAGRDPADVARGTELLNTPEGSDPAGRQTAAGRAERERRRCEDAITAATEKIGTMRSELNAATPSDNRNVWIQLPDDRRPITVEHGRALLEAATTEQRAAQERLEHANAHAAGVVRRVTDAAEAARAFREVLAPLETLLGQTDAGADVADTTEPFAGSAEQAAAATSRVLDALRRTDNEERASRSEVTRLVDAAVHFANQPQFEAMTHNLARRALVGLEREQLAARAAEFAAQLDQRLATLTTDLDAASRHRKLIVERLSALVDGALKTLRTASRLSKLPAGLGDWEGKEFLRIRFTEADPSLLAARVGEVVDELAAVTSARAAGTRGSAPKRDGLALLLRSIDAAVPKGFTVDVLKPDAVLRDERVPVEDINDVFSGGQELTAAIVLYCTMAALRANERGQLRARHSGVLFLDNPIGKASAEYLLELQQGVASALGVQLVYTTGLSDDRALAAFPLWVRMRNDADLRAGMKHIRVAEVVRRQLPEPFADDEAALNGIAPGMVTATRVYRRPA